MAWGFAQPIPPAALPDAPEQHGQYEQAARYRDERVPELPRLYWPTDDSWRSIQLPYQRNYSLGRLGYPIADHLVPTGAGYNVAVAGAGIGRPTRLESVPVYHYGPDGQLMRAGRAAQGNPTQWTTTAAFDNGVISSRAQEVRWPSV